VNGIHDMGGMHGYGPAPDPRSEAIYRPFHAAWEARVRSLAGLVIGTGCINVDAFRHAIERLDPLTYLGVGYYGRWLSALDLLLADHGGRFRPGSVATGGASREIAAAPRFGVGDAVRTRNLQPSGHTRLPGYARGKRGEVALVQGAWVFPDTNAHGAGERPQHVYSVGFAGRELFGGDAEPGLTVHVDLFESYLEPA
jgi:nitrile hydratase